MARRIRSEYAQTRRDALAVRNLSVIPEGATVAYTDASIKGTVARCAVIMAMGYPNVNVITELVLDPGDVDINRAELAAIVAAASLGPDYIISDSQVAIGWLQGGLCEGVPVVCVPGDVDIAPGHRRAHDLAGSARREAEEG